MTPLIIGGHPSIIGGYLGRARQDLGLVANPEEFISV